MMTYWFGLGECEWGLQEACADSCSSSPNCDAFEWYQSTAGYQNQKCHIYTGIGGSGGTSLNKVTQGGGVFLDAECYLYSASISLKAPTASLVFTADSFEVVHDAHTPDFSGKTSNSGLITTSEHGKILKNLVPSFYSIDHWATLKFIYFKRKNYVNL